MYNFGIEGVDKSDFINDIDTSNTINGKPMRYLISRSDLIVPSDAGYVGLINCTNIEVKNISLKNNLDGILLAYTQNITTIENNLTNNVWGLHLIESSNNTIVGNNLTSNRCGARLEDSSNNILYHNSFKDNTCQVEATVGCANIWDNGYPSGGNHWSNYDGTDLHSGPCQNMTGSDGIGDRPYDIDENNRDHYPLMKPYGGSHDIGIANITTSKALIIQNYSLSINVKIVNYGTNDETLNVTAYANEIIIQTETITLTNRNSMTITLTWNTTGFVKGKYAISAKAHPVPDEIDTTDNTLADGLVKIILQAHDIAVTDIIPHKTVVGKGYNAPISIIAENWGNYPESFNVTAYYNPQNATGIPIETQTVTLTSGNSTNVPFMWNTTDIIKGNYTITATVTPIPGEIDTTDNTLTHGWIIVAMICDITGPNGYPDGTCDMRDVGSVVRLFGKNQQSPLYAANCDIAYDLTIDMRDVGLVARHFGETDP